MKERRYKDMITTAAMQTQKTRIWFVFSYQIILWRNLTVIESIHAILRLKIFSFENLPISLILRFKKGLDVQLRNGVGCTNVLWISIYLNFKHQRQRAQATYMPIKIKYNERMHVRQWNKIEQLCDREIKWRLYNENVKLQITHVMAYKQR